MGTLFAWPMLRLVERLSMALTLGCLAYVVYFLLMGDHGNSASLDIPDVPVKDVESVAPALALDLKPYAAAVSLQERDIFSMSTAVGPSGAVENTPAGELPAHLKIVGILVADKPQVIIEDTLNKKTYFIDKGHPQAGIKIKAVTKDQMVINYQGQDIPVSVKKN